MTADALVVVQARMGSTRLPGKVLADVGGRPILALMLARLRPLADHGLAVVLATSDLAQDDPVAELAAATGAAVVRGSESDVLSRFVMALQDHPAAHIVRLTADCPLVDPDVVLAALELHQTAEADYTSNTLVRTFPDGLDVEVVRAAALHDAAREADDAEREHVTPFVYRRPRRYHLAQLAGPENLGRERWTVDRAEDLEVIREAVAAVDDPVAATWKELWHALGTRAPAIHGAVVAVPGPVVQHERGQPYRRAWRLTDRTGDPIGTATVSVDDGIGSVSLDLAPDSDPSTATAAIDAVRGWLSADLQIRELQVDLD